MDIFMGFMSSNPACHTDDIILAVEFVECEG